MFAWLSKFAYDGSNRNSSRKGRSSPGTFYSEDEANTYTQPEIIGEQGDTHDEWTDFQV